MPTERRVSEAAQETDFSEATVQRRVSEAAQETDFSEATVERRVSEILLEVDTTFPVPPESPPPAPPAPSPDPVGSVAPASGEYQLVIAHINGDEIDEIPLVEDWFYSWVLNAPGGITFKTPLRHPKVTRSLLSVGKREIHLYRKGILVWGGYLWNASASASGGMVEFAGQGYYSRLRRRLIADPDNPNTPTDPYSFGTFQEDIAWGLINFTQTATDGDLGFVRAHSEQSIDRTNDDLPLWNPEESATIADGIETVFNADDGVDFEIDENKKWWTFYERKGADTGAVLALGKNILNWSYNEDGMVVGNQLWGVSADALVTVRTDNPETAEAGLLMDRVTATDIWDPDLLDKRTDEELRIRKVVQPQPTVHARYTEDLPYGSIKTGDTVRVVLDAGYASLDKSLRVNTVQVNISAAGQETMNLGLEEPPP